MYFSFLLYVRQYNNNLVELMESLNFQTNKNFEVIAIIENNRDAEREKLIRYFRKLQQNVNKQIKFVINCTYQGVSYCYNFALTQACGDYVAFWKPQLKIKPDFTNNIAGIIDKCTEKPDLISLNVSNTRQTPYNGLMPAAKFDNSLVYFKKNQIVIPSINFNLHNKLFKRSILSNNKLFMKTRLGYNLLFLFKFISFSRSYYFISAQQLENIIDNNIEFSVLNLVKQWIHLFNFFNNENIIDDYADELNYVLFYYLLQHFIGRILTNVDNRVFKRAVSAVHSRLFRRLATFKFNPYLKQTTDKDFIDHINNFRKYFISLGKTRP